MQAYKLTFISACLGMLLFGISLITLGSVAPGLQQKFQLDAVGSGTLFSILPIGILTGSLLFGPFCDRYGYKFFFLLSCLCLFAGFQGIAYAGTLGLLKFCIFLFGFGGGAINGATNAVISDISENNKGANLSLLGVFFGIGALGMPSVLGVLEKQFGFQDLVSYIGWIPVLAAVLFLFTGFPPPKQTEAVAFSKVVKLMKDNVLLLIGFFLLCQSSFEAIINNWTTSYLVDHRAFSSSNALYALSLYVAGMTVMRLAIGSVFRHASPAIVLAVSFVLLLAGGLWLHLATAFTGAAVGLVLIGSGLAAGFPVMLGLAGIRFAGFSGTAFSIIFTIALAGNMTTNYLMGVVAWHYGIQHLTTVALILFLLMIPLSVIILRKTKS
jgi:MFS family permease